MDELFEQAAAIIEKSDALLIGSGAGMGVDSGLPDFRGKEGFWKAYPPIAKLGCSFEEMANPYWFEKQPRLAWAFYGHRFNLYKSTIPHKGFEILLEIGRRMENGCFVFTSNVDGQFQKAGFVEDNIYEIHGSIFFMQCTIPCSSDIWEADFTHIELDEERFEALGPLPSCPNCGSLARPNVLMFGDWSWIPDRSNVQSHRYNNWISKLSNDHSSVVVVEIGAGTSVPSVRHNSQMMARKQNCRLIRINPRECNVTEGQVGLPCRSLYALQNIADLLQSDT